MTIRKITTHKKIILASASKIRENLLLGTGVDFQVMASPFDEEGAKVLIEELDFSARSKFLALGKARAVSMTHQDAYCLGADQLCVLEAENRVFSKPKTVENAVHQLQALSGKTHSQISGISICLAGSEIWSHSETSYVSMRDLSLQEIERYVALDKPLMACGSYQVEGFAKHLFSKIEGNEDNVLGLPLVPILAFLHRFGIISL